MKVKNLTIKIINQDKNYLAKLYTNLIGEVWSWKRLLTV